MNATDEALYARADFLEEPRRRRAGVRRGAAAHLEGRRRQPGDRRRSCASKYGLLPDLPDDAIAEAVPYFEEAVANGVYPLDGGEPQDASDDIAFLAAAGQVEGDPAAVDPAAFWDFTALEAAKAAN